VRPGERVSNCAGPAKEGAGGVRWEGYSTVGKFPLVCVRYASPLSSSDVKIMIRVFLCHVREDMVKTKIEQNANTGVFSQGDFLRDPAQRGKHDLRGDRPS
jgi:hypothetical protein